MLSVCILLTILKDSLDIEAVGGAGLVVGAPLEVRGQFPGPRVLDHSRVAVIDSIWNNDMRSEVSSDMET